MKIEGPNTFFHAEVRGCVAKIFKPRVFLEEASSGGKFNGPNNNQTFFESRKYDSTLSYEHPQYLFYYILLFESPLSIKFLSSALFLKAYDKTHGPP